MKKTLIAALGLALLWVLMSGLYYKTLIQVLGAISIILTLFFVWRMDNVDGQPLRYPINALGIFRYFFWLMKEIAKSNWNVAKIVLSGRVPGNQKMVRVGTTQKSDMGKVIFAQSITLTPGTISVDVEEDCILVHALSFSEGDMDDLHGMGAQVASIESARAGG